MLTAWVRSKPPQIVQARLSSRCLRVKGEAFSHNTGRRSHSAPWQSQVDRAPPLTCMHSHVCSHGRHTPHAHVHTHTGTCTYALQRHTGNWSGSNSVQRHCALPGLSFLICEMGMMVPTQLHLKMQRKIDGDDRQEDWFEGESSFWVEGRVPRRRLLILSLGL